MANGQVLYVTVDDQGAGYYPPLSVVVDPAPLPFNTIPIWAPAGALTTSMSDMMQFASAALGDTNDPSITAGFQVAETPYACARSATPSLAGCPLENNRFGLAWSVSAGSADYPVVLDKNGGLPGYSTDVLLMPERHLAVVVFVNTNDDYDTGAATQVSEAIAGEILRGLFVSLPSP